MLLRERLAADLATALERARAAAALPAGPAVPPQVDVPPSPDLGDFSSDLALRLGEGVPPAAAAEALRERLTPPEWVEGIEATPSGFLNFRLRAGWLVEAVEAGRRAGPAYGQAPDLGAGRRVLLEFVSAHPTGPLTLAHGRGAVLGDALAGVLAASGFRPARESYVNDVGIHMERLARAVEAHCLRSLGRPAVLPPDSYRGEYVQSLAAELAAARGAGLADLPPAERLTTVRAEALAAVLRRHARTLAALGVRFDRWFAESSLHDGRLARLLADLREVGALYELDGALWLRATAYGDTEDRPLLRSNGQASYLAGDLAYHQDKLARGFDLLLDVWGAEHGGYAGRTRAGCAALGMDPGALEILIFQPVALRIDGMVADTAGLHGNTMLLEEVVDLVGAPAARLQFLSRPVSAALEFDLDAARRADAENPAIAVREALASARAAADPAAPLEEPAGPARELLREVAALPDEVRAAARERDPYRVARHTVQLARAWTAAGPQGPGVADAVRTALEAGLGIVGVQFDADGKETGR